MMTAFRSARGDGAVTAWLWTIIGMIFVMVILGGVTRLTESGLSMVDWRPIMGIIPPLGHAEWERVFHAYQKFPEYQDINYGMTLGQFQAIFLMEYTHRLWGRLIGIVFLLPFLWFLVTGRVRGRFARGMAVIFVLGGAQGLVGWFMVRSGLVDIPTVSAYRLTAHLGLAVALYLVLLWIALGRSLAPVAAQDAGRLRGHARLTLALGCVTLLSGGFMAGLDAGLTYNTFPLMDGRIVPAGILSLDPWWRNLFENIATVNFDHRVLAITTALTIIALWLRSRTLDLPHRARLAVNCAGAMALVQPALGIATLLLVVPVPLASAHQGGALVLLTMLVWVVRETSVRRSTAATAPLPAKEHGLADHAGA